MQFSESWLRLWSNPDLDTPALCDRLTDAGLEVEGHQPAWPDLASHACSVRVLDATPHPELTGLYCYHIDTGSARHTVVSRCSELNPGDNIAWLADGNTLADGSVLQIKEFGNVSSHGMLCAEKLFGLSDAERPVFLPADTAPGTALHPWLAPSDQVIEVDLTPNRGDCLSILGLARELAALTSAELTVPAHADATQQHDACMQVSVQDKQACPNYCARVMHAISPAARTPLWLQSRLALSGIRCIHPVVDICNYVMLELGQPMHAFDLDRLNGSLQVRWAQAGESLTLLNQQTITLTEQQLVIADADGPQALAGIMGGQHSAVHDTTQTIVLEAAHFHPDAITGRSRQHGLHTDSSHRFERGTDPDLPRRALQRASQLIQDITGGQAGPISQYKKDQQHTPAIDLPRSSIQDILGCGMDDAEVVRGLSALGFAVKTGPHGWQVTPPSHRFDCRIQVDLLEELARIIGYEQLPASTHWPMQRRMQALPATTRRQQAWRQQLAALGFHECVTYSFIDPDWHKRCQPDSTALALSNPISQALSVMRTSLWPGLLHSLQRNRKRQVARLQLFECGKVFPLANDQSGQEREHMALLMYGKRLPPYWKNQDDAAFDFFDLKGIVDALLAELPQASSFQFQAANHPMLHQGQSAELRCNTKRIGWLGCLHPSLAAELGLEEPCLLFEIELQSLLASQPVHYQTYSRQPAVHRDLALLVSRDTPATALEQAVREKAGPQLKKLQVFDVYQGKGMPENKKSIAISLTFQDKNNTLNDADLDQIQADILYHVAKTLGATLR